LASVVAGSRADINYMVGVSYDILVVFDHEDGVSDSGQSAKYSEQSLVVTVVQANGGFIKNITDSYQTAADLGGQANALCFTSGECAASAVECKVSKADIDHKPQTAFYLFYYLLSDDGFFCVKLKLLKELLGLFDAHDSQLMNIFVSDFHGDRLRSQPGAATGAAGLFRKIAMEPGLYIFAGGVFPTSDKVWDNPFELQAVFFYIGGCCAFHQDTLYVIWYLLEWGGFADGEFAAETLYQAVVVYVHSFAALSPGLYRPVCERPSFVGDDKVWVKFKNGTQPITTFAGSIRTIEAKKPWREFFKACLRVLWTGEFFAVNSFLPMAVSVIFFVIVRLLQQDEQDSVSQFQSGFDRVSQTYSNSLLDYQPVDDSGNVVFFVLVERWYRLDIVDCAVNADANKSFPLDIYQDIAVLAFFSSYQRSTYLDFCTFRIFKD
jgi:hypothetical protein